MGRQSTAYSIITFLASIGIIPSFMGDEGLSRIVDRMLLVREFARASGKYTMGDAIRNYLVDRWQIYTADQADGTDWYFHFYTE